MLRDVHYFWLTYDCDIAIKVCLIYIMLDSYRTINDTLNQLTIVSQIIMASLIAVTSKLEESGHIYIHLYLQPFCTIYLKTHTDELTRPRVDCDALWGFKC